MVGRVLGEVEATGRLPGEHHFYITFKTGAAGVDIPRHLSERFPDEMTIVIQNRFWDLKVREDGFEVGLSFNQAPAKLFIPFSAITGFVDPAVDFALQFQARAEEAGARGARAGRERPAGRRADRGRLERRLGRFQPEEVGASAGRLGRRPARRAPPPTRGRRRSSPPICAALSLCRRAVARMTGGDRVYFCAGTLVAPRWILTAAHCFHNPRRRSGSASGDLWAEVGGDLARPRCPTRPQVRIDRIVVHPDYDPASQANDIALVRLDQEAGPLIADAARTTAGAERRPGDRARLRQLLRRPARRPGAVADRRAGRAGLGPAAPGRTSPFVDPAACAARLGAAGAATGAYQLCTGRAGATRHLRRRFRRAAGRRAGRTASDRLVGDRQLRLGLRRPTRRVDRLHPRSPLMPAGSQDDDRRPLTPSPARRIVLGRG